MSIIGKTVTFVALALCLRSTEAGATPPKTDPVIASFGVTLITAPVTHSCTGVDGAYTELTDTFSGPVLSTDPRLNGTLNVTADILVNTTTGFGAGSGTWNVKNLLGQVLVSGTFKGAVSGLLLFKGLAEGHTPHGEKFFGNISVIVAGNAAVGSIGAPLAAVPTEPAVFQVGSCTGSGP
jgi:hypothetical protein